MRIYTKTGDQGETSLFSGGRVGKAHARVEAYGCLDELSAVLGLLRSEALPEGIARRITRVQDVLLVLGSAMADAKGGLGNDPGQWTTGDLEDWIDDMELELEPLGNFILPGGSRAAAVAHVARTVCRRAERRAVAVEHGGETLPDGVVAYLNRLSDLLFVLARFINHRAGVAEERWESPSIRKRS